MTQVKPPIRFKDITISYVTVSGGLHTATLLTSRARHNRTNGTNEGSASDRSANGGQTEGSASGYGRINAMRLQDEPEYHLQLGVFSITYAVQNCATGIPRISSYFSLPEMEDVMANTERVSRGSPAIGGVFDLEFRGMEIRSIPFDVEGPKLEQILELNFPDEGGRL